ncbi:helix-turn-helix domain-containing protein [Nonomuraea basaltis]|uniref:helix-turn-helix domain-containing protein n=1 Tax=Nonomuraea basaltis TaxID=2495887 RepID=UPI0014864EBC|nr:helix-turn-helix transcriptional regulator [Nonomuraea basaltis]
MLGRKLTGLRDAAGMTCGQVASSLKWSPSKVSRLERGVNSYATAGELTRLLDLYGVDAAVRAECQHLLRTGRITPPWEEHKRGLGGLVEYVAWETEASRIQYWHPLLIPGQLQTEAYARAIIAAGMLEPDEALLAMKVRARLARQWITRCDNPVHLHALIGEQALRQQVGGPDVMAAQLDKLVLDTTRPNVTIQIIPQERAVGLSSGFVVLTLPGLGEVLFLEAGTAGIIDQGPRVVEFKKRFGYFLARALPADQSAGLITDIRKGLAC